MSEHSPGPFGFLEADHHDDWPHRCHSLKIHDAEHNDIATLWDEGTANGPTTTRKQAVANAYLFAAGPDLLAAAKAIDAISDFNFRMTYSRAFHALRDAIAKAEGR